MISEITELAGREAACATGALYVTHGFGTHVPGTSALAGVMFDHVSSELGTPNRRHAFETGLYIDPCPPGLQSPELGEMDVWPIRPGAGRIAPEERLPPQFLELPERPLVYVTLGTVFNDPDLVRSVLDAIQDLPISIAITTGPGTDPALLGPRPANVAAASFVPQALLLPLASAVVSHTGSGTMLGALAAGLPQVCLPRGADQFANAERVHATVRASGCCPTTSPRSGCAPLCRRFSTTPPTRAATAMKSEIAAMPSAADVLDDLVGLAYSTRRIA